jgi:hypothetical protein
MRWKAAEVVAKVVQARKPPETAVQLDVVPPFTARVVVVGDTPAPAPQPAARRATTTRTALVIQGFSHPR